MRKAGPVAESRLGSASAVGVGLAWVCIRALWAAAGAEII